MMGSNNILLNFRILLLYIIMTMSLGQPGIRYHCLKNRIKTGCDKKMIDRYPQVSMSADNTTKAETYFYLFTRKNQEDPEFLHDCGGSLPPESYFNSSLRTVILIHGYIEDVCSFRNYREIKNELLKRDDYNVIVVDYSWGNQGSYCIAIKNGKIVGKQLAILIRNIMSKTGIRLETLYLIGHSLGAQISAFTSQELLYVPGKLGRITGLDPAGPKFEQSVPYKDRLDQSDALLVDIIHTSAGPPPFLGINYTAGHADFYVNGGSVQHSCYTDLIISFLRGDFKFAMFKMIPTTCFHSQSVQYFKVSINPDGCLFVGTQCRSDPDFIVGKCDCGLYNSKCTVMGMDFENYYNSFINGIGKKYYLDTRLECPYCDNSLVQPQSYVNNLNERKIFF